MRLSRTISVFWLLLSAVFSSFEKETNSLFAFSAENLYLFWDLKFKIKLNL